MTTNFLEFDANKTNIMADVDYANSTYRSGGAVSGTAPSDIHNKLYRQCSVMVSAIAQVMSDLGYTVSDSNRADLVTVMADMLTVQGGNLAANKTFTLGKHPTTTMHAATKGYVDNQAYALPTANATTLGGVKVGASLNMGTGGNAGVLNAITAQSLNTNGYATFASGLIIQWGRIAKPGGGWTIWPVSNKDVMATANFPIAFPTSVLNISLTVECAPGDDVDFYPEISAYTANSLSIIGQHTDGSSYPAAFHWFAIGY